MASQMTTTTFDNALKVLYPAGFEQVWYKKCPFVAWIPKEYDFGGSSKQINPLYGGVRTSPNFAVAMAGKSTPSHAKFNVTRVKQYLIGSIENEVIEASKGKPAAIAEALKTALDAAMYSFGRTTAFQVWGDGTGTRGTVGAYAAGVITLSNRYDIVHFEVGDMLVKKTAAGVLLPGRMLVTAINTNNAGSGELTVTLLDGAAAPAATDTLAQEGEYTAAGSVVLSGVRAWVPAAVPTPGDNFFGVDRSVFPTRLAGIRMNGGGKSIEEIVFEAQAEASVNGADVDTLWMNSHRFAALCKSIQSKAWYGQNSIVSVKSSRGRSGKVNVGFQGFVFPGESGPVTVMSDPNCPYAYGLMTSRKAWKLSSLKGAPHFAEEDGRRFRQEVASDAIEFRLKAYWNLMCKRPLDNVLIDWDN